MNNACEIIKRFKGKKVVVIGDVILDHYTFGEIRKLNPEKPGSPLLTVTREEYRLGGAANVANNLASFGAKVTLIGLIGKDYPGEKLLLAAQRQGIEFIPIYEGETLVKERSIVDNPNNYLMRVDRGEAALEPISMASVRKVMKSFERYSPDVSILADYNKRVFREDLSLMLIERSQKNKTPVVVAPKPENIGRFIGQELVCLNLDEAGNATGIRGYEKIRESTKAIKDMTRSRYTVITCGRHGMVSYDGNYHKSPTVAKEVIDVSGAGDTVLSTLALSLISGADIITASNIANYAAGIVVEKQGTAVTSRKELIDRIR